MDLFSDMFKRQVYGADQDRRLVKEALSVTQTHALVVSRLFTFSIIGVLITLFIQLRDVGLDFSFQLARLGEAG